MDVLTHHFVCEDSAFGSLESLIEQGLEEDAVLEGQRDEKVSQIVDELQGVRYSMRVIRGLSDALNEYKVNGDIATFVENVREVNDKVALGHPMIESKLNLYAEDGDAEWFAEKIEEIVGDFDGGYAPYTAGSVRYSLSSSNKSAIRYDKENGTNVKEFFDFLRNGKVFEDGKPDLFHIANAGELLQRYGIKVKFMVGRFTYSNKHTKDEAHKLDVKEWVDVINTINTPLAIASYKGGPNEYRIYTYAMLNGETICVGVNVSLKNNEIELSNIISAYGRNINKLFGPELVYLLYPKSEKELKRKISQVSTEPNSPLNATSAASVNKDTTSNAEIQINEQKFSLITPEMDASYMDAVNNGDMETAQQMVMEAAKRAGYTEEESADPDPSKVFYEGNFNNVIWLPERVAILLCYCCRGLLLQRHLVEATLVAATLVLCLEPDVEHLQSLVVRDETSRHTENI